MLSDLIAPTVNLVILVGLLVYYLREPLKKFVHDRHASLRDELQRVRDLLRQAQAKYDEFTGRLKSLDAEIAALREQAKQDGQAMRQRILSEAQKMAGMVVSDARAAAGALYSDLRSELFAEVGVQVVNRAERLLRDRLTGDDRARIRQEFSTQVERAQ